MSVTLRLDHDFNNPRNEGGFYEVVLPQFIEANFHTGDIVDLSDSSEPEGMTLRGRIRCLVAVIEPVGEPEPK